MLHTKVISLIYLTSEIKTKGVNDVYGRRIPWADRSTNKGLYSSAEPYFVERKRGLGEADLQALAETGMHLGVYFYISSINTWFSVHSPGNAALAQESCVLPSIYKLDLRQFEGNERTYYYYYPDHLYDKKFIHERDKNLFTKHSLRKLNALGFSLEQIFPDLQDIAGYTDLSKLFPTKKIEFVKVSKWGKLSFKLLPEGRSKVLDLEELSGRLDFSYQYPLNMNTQYRTRRHMSALIRSLSLDQLIDSRIEIFNTFYSDSFRMEFSPFE